MKVQEARCQEAPTIPPLMEDQTLTSERSACAERILASHSQEVRNATSSKILSATLPSAPSHHSQPNVLVLYHPKLTLLHTLDIRPLGDALRAAKATSLVADSLWAPVPYWPLIW